MKFTSDEHEYLHYHERVDRSCLSVVNVQLCPVDIAGVHTYLSQYYILMYGLADLTISTNKYALIYLCTNYDELT